MRARLAGRVAVRIVRSEIRCYWWRCFVENQEERLEFDLRVHSLLTIKKAAYRFADRWTADIQQVDDNHVWVILKPRTRQPIDAAAFRCEVLDQDLRQIIAEETTGLRNILLAQAFSELSVVDPQGDSADFHDDPLGVAFEAHGKLDNERSAKP
jgi:His-Xaa-Ser system protein HxsD